MVLRIRKPGIAASFLHRQLNQVASSQEATLQRNVNRNLKDIKAISGKKNSFGTPPVGSVCWKRLTCRKSTSSLGPSVSC